MGVSILNVKSGAIVRLANGWKAKLLDNVVRGTTRFAEVYGVVTESGSVYSHDIEAVCIEGKWESVEHTDRQLKCKAQVNTFF